MADEETALVRTDEGGYVVLNSDVGDLMDTMKSNLGPMNQLSPFDLQRISIPNGGAVSWTIPTLKGPKTVEEIPCVVCGWHPCRGYWPGAFSGSEPPQCASSDGITGEGDPGGLCAECEFNQWGSATDDEGNPTNGKACKEMRRVFILMPDTMIPYVLTLPPTSITPLTQYLVGLSGANLKYWEVETCIGLEQDKNNNGVQYSTCTFELSRELSEVEKDKANAYAEQIQALVENPEAPTAEDRASAEPTPPDEE